MQLLSLAIVSLSLLALTQDGFQPTGGGGLAERFRQLDRNERSAAFCDRLDASKDDLATEKELKALWRTRP